MGIYDSSLGIAKNQLAGRGSASVRTLDDILRQQKLAVTPSSLGLPDIRALTRQRQQADPGGWQGVLSDVMGSLPGKVIMKAGEIISMPGRAVTSVVQEFVDALDSDPNTVASWNDFGRQVMDPSFGFGTVIGDLTGMKWVDRLLGFAGDVVLDPLTYLTLGASRAARVVDESGNVVRGAKTLSIATADGRMALANKIRELGASDELTKLVARRGRAALRGKTGRDLLEKAGYDRAGLYWFGKRIKGSDRIGEAFESGLAGLRVWSGDHIFNKVGSLFTPGDMVDLRKAIARGQAPAADVGAFMDMVLSRNVERADAVAGVRQAQSIRQEFTKDLDEADISAARSTAYRYLDVGGPPINVSTPEGRVATQIKAMLEQMYKNVEGAAKALDKRAPIGKIPDSYFPHMATDRAFKWMQNNNNPGAVKARGQVFNPFDNTGSWKARMVEGDEVGTYVLTQADIDGGIDSLNKIFRREYQLDFDFFETDLIRVLDRYDQMYGGMLGKIGRKKFLTERGTYQIIEERLQPIPEIQEMLQKQLKANAKSRLSKQKAASKKLADVAGSIDNMLGSRTLALQAQIAEAGKAVVATTFREGKLGYAKSKVIREIRAASEDLKAAAGSFRAMQDAAERSPFVTFLDAQQDALIAELDNLADDIEYNDLMETLGPTGIQERAMEINRQIQEFSKIEEEILRKANVLGEHFEAILTGTNIEGNVNFSKRIRSAFRTTTKVGDEERLTGQRLIQGKVQGKGQPYAKIDGVEYKGVRSREWWGKVNRFNPIKPSSVVKRATKAEMRKSMQRTIRGSVGIDEMRNLGMVVAAMIDTLPEGSLSQASRDNFEKLVKALEDADRSSQYYKQLSMARRNRRSEIIIGQVKNNYDNVENGVQTNLNTHFAAASMLQEVFSDIDLVGMADEFVPGETIYRLLQDPRYENLAFILGRYADGSGTWSTRITSFGEMDDLLYDPVQRRVMGDERTSRYELKSEGGVGAVTRDNITYGELESILSKAVNASKAASYDLKLETNTILDGVLPVRPKGAPTEIRVADLIDELYAWTDERGIAGVPKPEDINNFVNERFWQQYKPWVEAIEEVERRSSVAMFDLEGARRVGKEINMIRAGEAPATGAKRSVTSKSQRRLQDLGEAQVRLAQATDPEEIKILQKQVNELQKAEFGDVPQRGQSLNKAGRSDARGIRGLEVQKEATDRFLAAVDDSLRPDDVLSFENAEKNLKEAILQTFFHAEIETRFQNLAALMAAEGLVPDTDLFRLVVNSVAKEFSDSSTQVIQEGRYAASRINEIIDLVSGNIERKKQLKQTIANPPKTAVGDQDMAAVFAAEEELAQLNKAPKLTVAQRERKKQLTEIVNNPPKGDAENNFAAVFAAEKELASLNNVADWAGREQELYETITRMLRDDSPNNANSWVLRVAEANGRHDVQSLLAEMVRLGGTKGETGIPNQRKKLVQMLKRASSPEEAAAIKAKLDSLPTEEALKKERADFYNKRALPWYRRNVDNAKTPSRADIESALRAVAPYATTGGRLAPDATVDEMLEWLNITAQNLARSNDEARRSYAWTLEAADPFLDVTRFVAGERGAQDLPSIYVESLLYTAKQVDAQRVKTEKAVKDAGVLVERADEAAAKSKDAERLLRGMDQPRGQFAGLVNEDDVPYFKETRKALIRLAEMKNNINTPGKPLYVAAVERREVNDLIEAVLPYVYTQETKLVYVKDVHEVAAEYLATGRPVYKRKRAGNPGEVREMQIIRKELDELDTQIAQSTLTLDIEFEDGPLRRVGYNKGQFDALQASKKLYNEKLERYQALQKRNPDNLEVYVKVTDPSELEEGYMYFYPLADSLYSKAPERLDEAMAQVTKLRQGRKQEEAHKILREIQDSMVPVRARANQPILIDGQALTLGPEEIDSLFGFGLEGQREFTFNFDDPNAVRVTTGGGRQADLLRATALQKMSAISTAIKQGKLSKKQFLNALDHTAKRNQGKVFFANDIVRNTRSEVIERAWNSSPEKAWLDEVAAFEQSINLGKWNAKVTNANRSINTAYNLRQKANEARGLFDDKTARYGHEVDSLKFNQAIGSGMSVAEARKFATVPAKRPTTGSAGEQFKFDEMYSGLEKELKGLDNLLKGEYSATTRFKELVEAGSNYNEAMVTVGKEVATLRPLDQKFVDATASVQSVIEKGDALSKELGFLKGNSLRFQRIGELQYKLDQVRKTRKDMISDQLRKGLIPDRLVGASRRLVELNNDLAELSLKFDQTKILRLGAVDHHNTVVPRLQLQVKTIEEARDRLRAIAKGNDDLMARHAELELWLEESKELLEEAGSTIIPGRRTSDVPPEDLLERAQWMMQKSKDTPDQRVYNKDYEKYMKLKAEYLSAVQDFILRDNSYNEAMRVMENLTDFDWAVNAKRLADEGMIALDKIGLPSYQATPQILELSRNMQQFIQPEFVRGLNRFIGSYTGFFKAYATSTPGFVVRNTMTNTFMLAAGGVQPRNMFDGLKLYRSWREAIANNTEKKFLDELSERGGNVREVFDLTVRSSDAAGFGRSSDAMAGWNPKRMTLKDNRYTRFHKRWNEASEGSARFIMAYDSVVTGSDFNTAVARVKKYFFDYEDIGAADEVLRSVIPFWFWMSRNLPLQLTNKWANPKAYLMYDKIMKNISSDEEEDRYLPSWMATIGATRIGGDTYLTPDLGFNRIEEDVTRLASPLSAGFLDMVNPGLRVPIELMTNRRFRYGNEFREEGQQAAGGPLSPAVQALAGLLGPFNQERRMTNGQTGVTDKFNYAAQALLPFLGQSERILPGTEKGKQNQSNAWLGYLGVPIRTVTPQDRRNERERQIYEQEELRRRAERGY